MNRLQTLLSISTCATTTRGGATPLYTAAFSGHLRVVELLIAAGADVNKACTNGTTPLAVALDGGHEDVAQRLLAAGATAPTWYAEGSEGSEVGPGRSCSPRHRISFNSGQEGSICIECFSGQHLPGFKMRRMMWRAISAWPYSEGSDGSEGSED